MAARPGQPRPSIQTKVRQAPSTTCALLPWCHLPLARYSIRHVADLSHLDEHIHTGDLARALVEIAVRNDGVAECVRASITPIRLVGDGIPACCARRSVLRLRHDFDFSNLVGMKIPRHA